MKPARRHQRPARLPGRARHSVRAAAPPTNGSAHGVTRPTHELTELRLHLAEAEEALRAIRTGEVDAVVVAGQEGPQVFTLQGAEHAYRVLIECMNEGALTLTPEKTILFANQCFAGMVKRPLEQVLGSSFRRFLSTEDRDKLRPLMKRPGKSGAKINVWLQAGDGSQIPAQLSIRQLAREGSKQVVVGVVVTNLTEVRRTEELLRALTQRLVQVQEAERGRVAFELHDNITQMLCAVLVRSQALANRLSARDGSAKQEAIKLRELLGATAQEVERISRNLRPSVLDELGLVAVLRDTSTEFAERTGVTLKLACVKLTARLPAATELTLYRILQEALKNVEQHARARHASVCLKLSGNFVKLTIVDDGVGFDSKDHAARRSRKGVLGLLGMHERAVVVGGTVRIKSSRRAGTEITVLVPLPPGRTANARRSKKQVASVPQLVVRSAKSARQAARKTESRPQASSARSITAI